MAEMKSSFARMDELEAEENLQSQDTLLERITPWEYSGRTYWLLRKLRLSPILAAGIGMVLAGRILIQLQMDFFGSMLMKMVPQK